MNLTSIVNKYQPKEKKAITVATLNYCDIMNNPFQFYCQEHEKQLQKISELFVAIIPQYIPSYSSKFKWNLGKIDQKIRIGRYSPAFQLRVGVKKDGFMTRQEFEQKWETEFYKIPEVKQKQVPFSEDQKNQTKLYDFILFHTLLSHVYGQKNFEKLIKNSPKKYLDTYGPYYALSFLSEDRKMQKFLASFSKIQADIFYIQQYSDKLKQAVEKTNRYHVVTDAVKDKLTIVKKSSFAIKKPASEVFTRQQIKDLTWSEDPAIMVVDNYIIINIHFSSKAERSKKQTQQMKKVLLVLKKKYCWYHFIIGGDINSFMGDDGIFEKVFNYYPTKETELTTIKKRTMTQGQHHKGNIVVAESKDKVISDLKILGGSIRYITNEEVKDKELIPTDRHPFDHFVLVAYIQKP